MKMQAALKIEANLCAGKLLRDYLDTRCPQSQARVYVLHGRPDAWGVCILKKNTRFYETQKGFYTEKSGVTIDRYAANLLEMAGYERRQADSGEMYFG